MSSAKYKLIIIREGHGAIYEDESNFVSVLIAVAGMQAQTILTKAHEAEAELRAHEYELEEDWERSFER